jgi:hypothetical protein
MKVHKRTLLIAFLLFNFLMDFAKSKHTKSSHHNQNKGHRLAAKHHQRNSRKNHKADRKAIGHKKKTRRANSKHQAGAKKAHSNVVKRKTKVRKHKSHQERLASLAHFFGVSEPVPNRGLSKENGSIKAGKITIKFPGLPKANKSPITINQPASAYPQVVTDPKKQKPIYVVPEIIYPHIKKRVIVHHNQSFQDYYGKMFGSMNPFYLQMAKVNPNYKDIIANDAFENLTNEPGIKKGMKEAAKVIKDASPFGSLPMGFI